MHDIVGPRRPFMNRFGRIVKVLVLGLVLAWAGSAPARDIALDAGNGVLYTANHDSGSVSKLDLGNLTKLAEFPLGLRPDNIAIDELGRIWITSRLQDVVGVYAPLDGRELVRIPTGDQPFDLLHLDNGLTAVTLYGAGEVWLIERGNLTVIDTLTTAPDPRGLALSPDGTRLLITHFRTGGLSIVDIDAWRVEQHIQPERDGNLFQNLAVSDDGARAYLPLTRSNAANRALTFDTTVFPVVSVIDLVAGAPVPSERLSIDIVDEPVAIPLDAALTEDYLFILNAGSNDLTVVDRDTRAGAAHLELGDNPRSMLLSPGRSRLFVHNALSGTVSVVDTVALVVGEEVTVTTLPLAPVILNGKRLFNSADRTDLALDQWIACATCHFDGEQDGRTWFFPDGPRNTTSLLGVAETLPIHWSGDLDELHDVERTIRDTQAGTGLVSGTDNCSPSCDQAPPNAGRSQDLDDLAAYMATLVLPENPNLEPNGGLSAEALRGMQLFHAPETGCASCHVPPLYTDRQRHDVGTGDRPEERKGPEFDTPSLRGVYATAPYLHDGRAATLDAVLNSHNPTAAHGATSDLTEQEISDLVVFLESLGFESFVFLDGFE